MTNTDRIIEGLKDACLTSFWMKNGDFTDIKPEYLLTTLVAKQFIRENSEIIVKLEEPTKHFALSCVPQFKSIFDFASEQKVNRPGRIDIGVYALKAEGSFLNLNKALFPIELKGINPQKSLFLKDVDRNLQYFMLNDGKTGRSILNEAYCASIEEAKDFYYKEDINNFIKSIQKKYTEWIKPLSDSHKHAQIELIVHVKEIMSQLFSKADKFDTSEGGNEWDYLQDWHLYVGVVIEIRRNYPN